MKLLYVILMSELDDPKAPLIFAVIAVGIVILIVTAKKKQRARRKQATDLQQKKTDFGDKMKQLSDTGLINILDNCKDYQIDAIKAALSEAKKRKLEFNYEKIKIEIEFSKDRI